jgi:hypothetical protein
MIREIWCEIKGLPKPVFDEVWDGPLEPRIVELKKKMESFVEKTRKQKEEYEK